MQNANTDRAYNYIRNKILSGAFAPGSFLSALSLSKEIGVSRTPVREALRQLENDDLVTIIPKLGAAVATLTAAQLRDLLGIREALEVYAAGRAALLHQPEELGEMKSCLDAMREATDRLVQDPKDTYALETLIKNDLQFHRTIIELARNEMLGDRLEKTNILQRMVSMSRPGARASEDVVRTANVMEVYAEHQKIFDAICAKDRDRAQAAMAAHLQNKALKYYRNDKDAGQLGYRTPVLGR